MEAFFLPKIYITYNKESAWGFIFLVYIEYVSYALCMSRFFILLMCVFISVSVTAETVYKTTNPDGSVEFSDKDTKDSEEIKVREPTIIPALRLPRLNNRNKKAKVITFEVTIIQPANDSTIIGNNKINVVVSVSPDLPKSHKFRYQLGKQSVDSRKHSVSLDNVIRGTHTLSVSVINSKGEVVSSGASSIFHMKHFFKKSKPKAP